MRPAAVELTIVCDAGARRTRADIVLLLQVPRHCLGVFAFARGRVGGDLWVRDGTPDFVHLASAGPRDIPGDLVRRDITLCVCAGA